MRVTFFKSSAEFRTWLETKHQAATELWVGFYKKESGRPSVTYSEAVDEALCFGWIDGVRKSVDGDAYTVRFTPRKPKSRWSAININHVRKLAVAGRMCSAGLKAFEGAEDKSRAYSYENRDSAKFDPADEQRFRTHKKAWEFFQAQASWYRRTATFWVISAKKEETRQRRLAQVIADSARNRTISPLTRKTTVPKRQKGKR